MAKQWSLDVWCAWSLRSSDPQRICIEAGFEPLQPSEETRFGQMSVLLLNMEKVSSVKSVWWLTMPKSDAGFCIWTSDFQVCMSAHVQYSPLSFLLPVGWRITPLTWTWIEGTNYYSSLMNLKQHDKHIAETKLYNTIKHNEKFKMLS